MREVGSDERGGWRKAGGTGYIRGMKIRPKKEELPVSYSLMLVAFPELEGTPFQVWLKTMVRTGLGPLRRGIENLLADLVDLARFILHGQGKD